MSFKNTLELAIKRVPFFHVFCREPMVVEKGNMLCPSIEEFNTKADLYGRKNADIHYKHDGKGVFLKPTHPVYERNFEVLFGFGVCCMDFDKERIVYYPRGTPEYQYFHGYFNQTQSFQSHNNVN